MFGFSGVGLADNVRPLILQALLREEHLVMEKSVCVDFSWCEWAQTVKTLKQLSWRHRLQAGELERFRRSEKLQNQKRNTPNFEISLNS